jgi:hypothetical protein
MAASGQEPAQEAWLCRLALRGPEKAAR